MRETLRLMACCNSARAGPAALAPGRAVYLKREDVHELGAFKWRGALPVARALPAAGRDAASSPRRPGTTARAPPGLRAAGHGSTVFAPKGRARRSSRTSTSRRRRRPGGADVDEAKASAPVPTRAVGSCRSSRTAPSRSSTRLRRDRRRGRRAARAAAGAVVVPSGTAPSPGHRPRARDALTGHASRRRRRQGGAGDGASWKARRPVTSDRCATIADGLAVRVAIPMPSRR